MSKMLTLEVEKDVAGLHIRGVDDCEGLANYVDGVVYELVGVGVGAVVHSVVNCLRASANVS